MFGGLAFLVGGNMAVSASGKGGIMVRVDPHESEGLVQSTPAEFMVMRGRESKTWFLVSADEVRTKVPLRTWIERAVAFVATMPGED